MPLNDIVNVIITRQTQTVSEVGFGIPLILGTSNSFTELIKFYSSIDEVAIDFSSSAPEYIAAQDIFSQEISPTQIAIGRRQVDNVMIDVQTAMTGQQYSVIVNGVEVTYTSTSANNYSIATLNSDLVAGDRVSLSVNGTTIGTTTSVIDFNIDFVTGNSILATINGTPITAVPFNFDQATTLLDLATALQATAEIATATITGARQITAVFAVSGANSIDSVITTLGATQPTASIVQGGFVFDTDMSTTMQEIADEIFAEFPTFTATVSPSPSRSITVQAPTGVSATFNSFVVTGSGTVPTATILNPLQPTTPLAIEQGIVLAINTESTGNPSFPVTATGNNNGSFNLINKVSGTAYTVRVDTDISQPNSAIVRVTQVEPSTVYTVNIRGVAYSYSASPSVQNTNEIVQGLVDLINVQDPQVDVSATNLNNGSFSIESNNAINTFSLSVSSEIMSVQQGLIIRPLIASNSVTDDLDLINNDNNTWYALISTSRDLATVKAIGAWTESHIKLFGTASSDPAIINVQPGTDNSSIAAFFNQVGYVRSFVMYHQDADYDYPEAAWFGRVLPLVPGSETWAYKRLNNISYSNLTTTQVNNALGKKANIYTFVGGVGITQNGTTAQGEYIDIIRGVDWLRARIQEFVYSLLVNNDKIAYTNAGITTVQAEVMRALALGVANNFLSSDPSPVVTVPRAENVPLIDKANRILRNVKFTATLAGAIHIIEIRGTVSL